MSHKSSVMYSIVLSYATEQGTFYMPTYQNQLVDLPSCAVITRKNFLSRLQFCSNLPIMPEPWVRPKIKCRRRAAVKLCAWQDRSFTLLGKAALHIAGTKNTRMWRTHGRPVAISNSMCMENVEPKEQYRVALWNGSHLTTGADREASLCGQAWPQKYGDEH